MPTQAWERAPERFGCWSGNATRPATSREELAAFIFMRCIVLSANLQFDEAYRTCQIACELSPAHPGYRNELEVIDEYRTIKQMRSDPAWVRGIADVDAHIKWYQEGTDSHELFRHCFKCDRSKMEVDPKTGALK